jgi:hypothetical protein
MKTFRLAIPLMVVVALLAGPAPAQAAPSTAICLGTWRVSFAPGLGLTVRGVDYKTDDGTIHCTGAVNGSPVSGAGTLAQRGHIDGTVLSGTGLGSTTLDIPTLGGRKFVSFDDTFSYGPGIGFKFSASISGPFTFMFLPVSGDGLMTPVTEIAVVGQFTLKS